MTKKKTTSRKQYLTKQDLDEAASTVLENSDFVLYATYTDTDLNRKINLYEVYTGSRNVGDLYPAVKGSERWVRVHDLFDKIVNAIKKTFPNATVFYKRIGPVYTPEQQYLRLAVAGKKVGN